MAQGRTLMIGGDKDFFNPEGVDPAEFFKVMDAIIHKKTVEVDESAFAPEFWAFYQKLEAARTSA